MKCFQSSKKKAFGFITLEPQLFRSVQETKQGTFGPKSVKIIYFQFMLISELYRLFD